MTRFTTNTRTRQSSYKKSQIKTVKSDSRKLLTGDNMFLFPAQRSLWLFFSLSHNLTKRNFYLIFSLIKSFLRFSRFLFASIPILVLFVQSVSCEYTAQPFEMSSSVGKSVFLLYIKMKIVKMYIIVIYRTVIIHTRENALSTSI